MNIYNALQIKNWDNFTINHEPIASIDLMERAAQKCVQWILAQKWSEKRFKIFCGKGNNGGDGLAIARLLTGNGLNTEVYIVELGNFGSKDFQTNLQRLHELVKDIHFIQSQQHFPEISSEVIVIDALFGSGLNKQPEGLCASLIEHINNSLAITLSIDVPSGLYIDKTSIENTVMKADITLTLQAQKLAFLMAENKYFTGNVQVLDIGLHPDFSEETEYQLLELQWIKKLYKPRSEFSHKGTFGHVLLMGGSFGKMGAMVLCAKAAMRTGAGLTTAYVPACGYEIMQTALPEAMVITGGEQYLKDFQTLHCARYNAIGIGPGLDTQPETQSAFLDLLLKFNTPVVIDADALNCLSLKKEFLYNLPANSILTPHPKEFERLFGKADNDFERIRMAKEKANELSIIIILKGHHTFIAMPDDVCYFNNTGNAGMATGGTGDVLTGMLTSLIGQGYRPDEAALLGVYIHGLAGDIAAEKNSMEALIASDIISNLGNAFKRLQ